MTKTKTKAIAPLALLALAGCAAAITPDENPFSGPNDNRGPSCGLLGGPDVTAYSRPVRVGQMAPAFKARWIRAGRSLETLATRIYRKP